MRKLYLFCVIGVATQAFSWTHLSTNIKGWKSKKLVFYVNPTDCTIPETTLNDILDSAMNAWNGVPHSSLEISRSTTTVTTTVSEFNAGNATQVPLILCDSAMSQPDVIPGVTTNTALDSDGNIIYSGILLNANTSGEAEISRLSRRELEVTIAHEIGHALGLGHSSDSSALMYFSIGGKDPLLTQDDMDGVAHIYPRSEFSGGTFGCASIHRSGNNQNSYWFWIGLLLVGLNTFVFRFRSERPL